MRAAEGMVVATTFASNVARLQDAGAGRDARPGGRWWCSAGR